jgi:phosphatidylglycerol:prolipoprotein diacylglycerol transferase
MIIYQNIDPIIFRLGPISIGWYGLCYIIGLISSLWYFQRELLKHKLLDEKEIESLLLFLFLGIFIGARIGYCLIYAPKYYFQHPLEIFAVWQGGLSFHGGFLGVLVVIFLVVKKWHTSFLGLADVAARSTPIGLTFGRIGNFLNSELYGRPTNGDWGIVFLREDRIPRHPSQLYESFLEGIVLFLILWLIDRRHPAKGVIVSFFILFYGIFRFLIEFFRTPDIQLGYVLGPLTMGQCLSIPMIIIGAILCIYFERLDLDNK